MNQIMNRETWLNYMTEQYIRPHFTKRGYTIPDNVRLSCSLTSRKKHIGECWSSVASADDTFEIFISPKISDSVNVLDILIHELCHATVGTKAGHGFLFKRCATAVGLEGKMTATTPSQALKDELIEWVNESGHYPHATLMELGIKKQSTRMIKCICGECGYTVRLAKKWLEVATPDCPNQQCESYGYSMTAHETETESE